MDEFNVKPNITKIGGVSLDFTSLFSNNNNNNGNNNSNNNNNNSI